MDGFKSSFSNIPYAFIFLLFSSIGIMQLYQSPLEDPTPSMEVDVALSPIRGHQKIPAKIWEDPFAASHPVLKHANKYKVDTTPRYLINGIFEKMLNNKNLKDGINCDKDCLSTLKNKIHIYAVPLTVDGWSATQETRIKRRYAAHMALYRQGYIPMQSSSIHSLCLSESSNLSIQNNAQSNDQCDPHQYIHYEILTKTEKLNVVSGQSQESTEVTLLLWVNNSQISSAPEQFIQQLSSQLLFEANKLFSDDTNKADLIDIFDFVAFWPPSSSGLAQVEKLLDNYLPPTDIPELKFRLINYSATAPFSSNHNTYLKNLTNHSNVNLRITFDTVIADDSAVVRHLLDELFEQRGFSPTNTKFILVTEWENIYSRKMAKAFQELCDERIDPSLKDEIKHCFINRFPYISGISGDSSYSSTAAIVKTKGDGKSSKQIEIRLPVGSSQYDYIRRSANSFNRKIENKRNTVFALFGSNLDDKLLVLQAIRDSNKESTIVTTDVNTLYTSLLSKYPIRNLIVASSYPLDTGDSTGIRSDDSFSNFQFRDSYQTSLYKAITKSLTQKQGIPTSQDTLEKNIKLYEVGKSNFEALVNKHSAKNSNTVIWFSDGAVLIKNLVLPFIMLILLMIAVWIKTKIHLHAEFNKPGAIAAFERTILKGLGTGIVWYRKLGAALVVYLIFFNLLFIFYVLTGSFTMESSKLFSGVSLWISEIGRALAICVILFSMTVSWTTLKKWKKGVSKRMVSSYELERKTDWNPFVFINSELLTKEKEHIYNHINFEKSWCFFRNELSTQNILIKAMYILLFLSFFGAWVYISQYGFPFASSHSNLIFNMPSHPIARGDIAVLYDRFFASMSNILLTLHIAYVTVITYICGRLVSHLSRGMVKWPQYYIDKLKKEYMKDEATIADIFSEYQVIKLIGSLTNTIGPQVVTPFVVLFLIIISRNTYFDNWNYPVSFLFFYSISGLCLLICAIWLKRLSTKAKSNALERLIIQKTRYLNDSEKSKSVDYTITLIKNYQKGAFSGWKDNPLVAAIMLPISSIIGVNVIPW